jgi:hypothetical protein
MQYLKHSLRKLTNPAPSLAEAHCPSLHYVRASQAIQGVARLLAVSLLVGLTLIESMDEPSAREDRFASELKRYKDSQLAVVLKGKSGRTCRTDSLSLPEGNGIGFRDAQGNPLPLQLYGLNLYVLTPDELKAILSNPPTKDSPDNVSKILEGRVRVKAKELKRHLETLHKTMGRDFRVADFDDVTFTNYVSVEPSSEARFIEGRYVVLLNARLLDFSTAMASLIYSLAEPVDETGTAIQFPKSDAKAEVWLATAKPRLVELVNHYLFDCPASFEKPTQNVLRFREYMEMFVLAHEFAHASLNHNAPRKGYGEILTSSQNREVAVDRWVDEVQADLYAQNVLQAKLAATMEDEHGYAPLAAGGFYLSCIEVLERAQSVIKGGAIDSDRASNKTSGDFLSLFKLMDPFPFSFSKAKHIAISSVPTSAIDVLTEPGNPAALLDHPPAYARAELVLGSVQQTITSEAAKSSFDFGVSMSRALLMLFNVSKEELLKK